MTKVTQKDASDVKPVGKMHRGRKGRRWWGTALSGVSSAVLFVAGGFSGVVASDLKSILGGWVWMVYGGGILLAAVSVILYKQADSQSEVASRSRLHSIPSPPGDFMGRKAELRELLKRVKAGGITISGLHGAGGVGKTVLALKLAHRLARNYPDAQIYINLMGVSVQPMEPREAMEHVIRAWDPEANLPDNEGELADLYRSVLQGKRALLLLDNARDCEQVEPLLPPMSCLLLVTSRRHFALPGCHTCDLEMLSPTDARKLVLRIAPRIGKHADDLVELCGRLPFALRKAASTLRTREDLSPARYMERLRDAKERLGLIDGPLSLSYDLLSTEAQRCWRMLAVFPSSFNALAAAAVWEVERDQAEDLLGELYLSSMLESRTEDRYELHDLSRVYADSKLTKSERSTAERRHAEHYCAVGYASEDAYKKGGEQALAGLALFDLERANIEAGQHWAAQQGVNDVEIDKLRMNYALGFPNISGVRLDPQQRMQWQDAVLGSARRLKDRKGQAAALVNLGITCNDLGEHRKAIGYLGRSLVIMRRTGDLRGEGSALMSLGNAYIDLCEYRKATEYYKQSLDIVRKMGDALGRGNALMNLGNAYGYLEEYRKAIKYYGGSLAIMRKIGNHLGEGSSLMNLGTAYSNLGEHRKAIGYYEQSLDIMRKIGDLRGQGHALGNLGNACDDLGEYHKAIGYYEQSLALMHRIGFPPEKGSAFWNMSLALDRVGKREEAIANAEAALRLFEQIESPDTVKVREKLAKWRAEG